MTAAYVVELGLAPTSGTFIIGSSLIGGPDVLDGALGFTWTDITQFVKTDTLSTQRGASRSQGPWFHSDPGTCSLTLDNNDGDRWNPLNTTGPYVSAGTNQLHPGTPIRVGVKTTASTVWLWHGQIDVYDPSYLSAMWSDVRISGIDAIDQLQNADFQGVAPVGYGDTPGQRITRVLDNIGWSATDRDIGDAPNDPILQATTLAQPAWTEILLSADSAVGLVYVSRDGRLTYRARGSFPGAAQYTFACDGTGIEYESVKTSFDRKQLINVARIANAGGTEVYAEDADSIGANRGVRQHQRSDLIYVDEYQGRRIAGWIVFLYGALQFRIDELTIQLIQGSGASGDSDARWEQIAGMEIGERVRVKHAINRQGDTITRDALIRGISWQWGMGPSATVTFSLLTLPNPPAPPFIVGSSLIGGSDVLYSI